MKVWVVEKLGFCGDFAFTLGPPVAAFATEEAAEEFKAKDDSYDNLEVHEVEFQCPAIDHLAALTKIDPETDGYCHHCAACLIDDEPHKPDCPYVAAKAFLDQLSISTD